MRTVLRLALSIGLSFAILAVLIHLVSSGLPDQDRPEIWLTLADTIRPLLLLYLGIWLLNMVIRSWRYRVLIRASGETQVPTMPQMFLVSAIRSMFVDMLPARIGELSYVAVLNRGYGVKLHHCASTLAASIAFDIVALGAIITAIVVWQLSGGQVQGWTLAILLSALVLSAIASIGLFFFAPQIIRYLRTWPMMRSRVWVEKIGDWAQKCADSLVNVRRSGKLSLVVVLSVAIRLVKYTGFYILFIAVAQPSFSELAELPGAQVIMALIGGELGASLPVPTFMSFGAYEAGGALVFQLLDIADKAAAVITLLCVHIWSQVVDYLIGGFLLALFVWLTRSNAKLTGEHRQAKQLLLILAAGGVLLAGMAALALELRAAKKLGAASAPPIGEPTLAENSDWLQQSKADVANIQADIYWSSNRFGNHDILRLSLPDMTVSRVTRHAHTEYFARVSPSGKHLLFARSQVPWVSQRNTLAWNVILLDLRTGKETLIAENATYPIWLDNDAFTYLKDGVSVERFHLPTNSKAVLYRSGDNNQMPPGAAISTPQWNPVTEQLVFTGLQSQIGMRTGYWGTALLTGEQHQGVHNGCQIAWSADRKSIYQVATGGNQGTRFMQVNPKTLQLSDWLDLEGEFSHEYWPKDSADGQYLVFGASRSKKEHEHDQADYELFLWQIGTDPTQATRLTFHTGNDNWPDIHVRK